jgi:multiple sugar transport system substrate-binding protein
MNISRACLILCLIAGLLLSACSPGDAVSTPEKGPEKAKPSAQITIWIPEEEDEFYSRLIEDFELINQDINLTMTEVPESSYVGQLDGALKSGTTPDIAMVKVVRWLKAGVFLSLDRTIQNDRLPRDDFNPGALSRNCVLGDSVYCLGTTTRAYILFYNLSFFDQAGVPYPLPNHPLSIDEFNASIRRISTVFTGKGENFIGGAIPTPDLWMDPRDFVSPDGKKIDRVANDESTSASFQVLAELIKDNELVVYDQSPKAEMETIQKFARGEIALLIADSSKALPIIEHSGNLWGAAVVPVEKKTDPTWTAAWTDGFGVLQNSRQAEKALQFISYLATNGSLLRLKSGQVPLNSKTALQWPGNDEARAEVLKAVQAAQPGVFLPDNPFLPDLFHQTLLEIAQKGTPAKKALDLATPEMQQHIDQEWQIFDQKDLPSKP